MLVFSSKVGKAGGGAAASPPRHGGWDATQHSRHPISAGGPRRFVLLLACLLQSVGGGGSGLGCMLSRQARLSRCPTQGSPCRAALPSSLPPPPSPLPAFPQALGGSVQRVVVTRVVGDIFYARIVLAAPSPPAPAPGAIGSLSPRGGSANGDGGQRGAGPGGGRGPGAGGGLGGSGSGRLSWSVDARPSDALALASEVGAEVFVAKGLAE